MITLNNLAQATGQQVFDQAATHLLKQNERSAVRHSNGNISCKYRMQGNKLMCGAGVFIADDEYKPEMDVEEKLFTTTWSDLIRRNLVPDTIHTRLIQMIQTIHDHYEPKDWWGQLHSLADLCSFEFTHTAPLTDTVNVLKDSPDTIELNLQ